MAEVPVERRHREYALRAMGEDPHLHGDDPRAEHWLNTGEATEEDLARLDDTERSSYDMCLATAQQFANFELELRIELGKLTAEIRDHAIALDKNWDFIHNLAMKSIRTALGMPEGLVPELVARIEELKKREMPY